MVAQHYRWDFIGLSTDTKPTPETSEKVVDGSTFYCSDNSKLYVFCKNNWYEKTVSGGGGTTYTAGAGINIADSEISVDTNTIQAKLTAGTGIDITDNIISATGGSGSTIKLLTTADYNYPEGSPSECDLWLLNEGIYTISESGTFKLNSSVNVNFGDIIIVGYKDNNGRRIVTRLGLGSGANDGKKNLVQECRGGQSTYYSALTNTQIVNGLEQTDPNSVLDGRQGKVLNDKITEIMIKGTTAPTTSTVGTLGQLYVNTADMHTYQCTDTTGGSYTWAQRW